MKRRPSTRLRTAIVVARRRRYAYAALRVLRAGMVAAVTEHLRRSTGPGVYVSEWDEIRELYVRGLREHLKRFGRLDFGDERGRP